MDTLARPWSSTLSGAILLPTIVGLLVIAIPVLSRTLIKILHAAQHNGAQIAGLDARHDARLKSIEKELHTNSGSSLKDAVIRTEERVTSLDGKLDQHLVDSAAQVARLDRHIDGSHGRSEPGGT